MPHDLASGLEGIDRLGALHWGFSLTMLWQSALVIALISALDWGLLRRGRASVRYAVWTLVLVKLLLPVTLPGPLSTILPPTEARSGATPSDATASSGLRGTPSPLPVRRPVPGTTPTSAPQIAPVETLASSSVQGVPVRSSFGWHAVLLALWAVVSLALLGVFIRQMLRVRRLVRKARPAPDELVDAAREAAALVGTRARIDVRISDELHSPALCGFWRGTILIPAPLAGRLSREQLVMVLAHELTHWRRGDLQVNTLQSLLQIVYFYNPLLWLANGVIRRVREYAVDEETLAALGGTAERYAETLVEVADQSRRGPRLAWSVVGAVPSRGALAGRVTRMLSHPFPRQARLGWPRLAGVCGLALLLLPMGRLATRSVAAEPPPVVIVSSADAAVPSNQPPFVPPTTTVVAPGVRLTTEVEIDSEKTTLLMQALEALTAEERAAFDTPAANEFAGIVIDRATVKPIAGATVREIYANRPSETKTNERGLFRLQAADESAVLLVTREGYGLEAITGPPTMGGLIVAMSDRTALEGTVTNAAGRPIPNARVRASWMWEMRDGGVPLEAEATSRADGTYRLSLPQIVPSGPYDFGGIDVQASAKGEGFARTTIPQVPPNQIVPVSFELRPGIRFEANVVDSVTGQPVAGFGLYRPSKPFFSVRSNAEGKLVLEDRPPGQLEVMCGAGASIPAPPGCTECEGFEGIEPGAYARWWSTEAHELMQEQRPDGEKWQGNSDMLWFDLQPGMQPVTIVVERGVVISGRVTDPEGRPVLGATVAPVLTGHGNSLSGDTRYSVATDREGKYRIALPASKNARYNLMVHDGQYDEWRGWANGVSRVIQTAPGETIENFDLQLSRPGVVRGRVVKDGKPVAGRVVKLQSVDRMENTYYDPKVMTKEDGTFEFASVRPGKHHLTATRFYSSKSEGEQVVEVTAGSAVEGLEIEPHGGE